MQSICRVSQPRVEPTCLVLNSRSIAKNFACEQLLSELISNSTDLCCLSENWLRSDTNTSIVTPEGHSILSKNGVDRRGGGIAILSRNDWKMEEIRMNGNENECLWAKISTPNQDYL